ncbi:MAG: DUF935 family protein [Candidatus Sericytochromatia bacterium]|nr:DUF935 family protein [Candidatus Sericytochromatia bacterium]
MDTKKIERPITQAIATTANGRDITRGYIEGLPYIDASDRVLTKAGGYDGYEKLLQDDQVSSCFAQRRHAVISRTWSVTPGGKKRRDKQAADFITETLQDLDWDTITDQFLYARFYGFAVAEMLWCVKNGRVMVEDIRVRDRRRFVFGTDFQLKLLTTSNPMGEALPAKKFWYKAVGASHADDPYGLGLGHALYWPVWFKHNGAKFWAVYLEKFGAPTALGEFPRTASETEQRQLLSTLSEVSTESGIAVPEGFKISLLEASRGGNASYENWQKYWDSAIAKIILGQTMTTDDGSSYSQATVHYDVRQDLVAADADLICESANCSWVKWLIDWNFPGAAYPKIYRDMEDAEDIDARVTRDKTLFDMGFRLKPDAVTRIYGDDYELAPEPAPAPAEKQSPDAAGESDLKKSIGFSVDLQEAPEPPSPIEPWAEVLDKEARAPWQHIIEQVTQLVNNAPDLPTLRDQLIAAYSDLPVDELADVMAQAFATAELAGFYEAANE